MLQQQLCQRHLSPVIVDRSEARSLERASLANAAVPVMPAASKSTEEPPCMQCTSTVSSRR
jgi:hypothetical protein